MTGNNQKQNKFSFENLGVGFKNSAFTPDDTAKGIMLFIIFQTIVTLLYQGVYFMGFDSSGMMSYVFTFILDACFVLAVYFIAKGARLNMLEELKAKKAPNILQIVLCFVLALVCIFGFSGLTNVFMQFLYNAGYVSTGEDIIVSNISQYLFYVVMICILPAVCEEILFRGLIFNGLKRTSATLGIFGSAFLFMLMHGNPDQTVHQFILGILLAVVYMVTSNIWVPILLHFFNNFIAVTYAYISSFQSGVEDAGTVEIYFSEYIIFAIISATIALFITIGVVSALKKNAESKNQSNVGAFTPSGTLGAEIGFGGFGSATTQMESAQDNVVNISSLNGAYQPSIESNQLPIKLTGQGKFLYGIAITWMAVDWILALFYGLTYVGV